MPQAKLTTNVRKVRPDVSIIDVLGEVNAFAENILTDAFARASEAPTKVIMLNFTGLEYMNSSGIGLLVTLLIRAQRQQQHMVAFGLSDHYRQIFELTRLNEVIALYANETEALAAFNASHA